MKYRSRNNYAQVYAGDKQGYNLGLDGAIYLREESSPRVFNRPRIGTQASSVSDAAPVTTIAASPSPATIKIALGGEAAVQASFATAGLATGVAIAAALETAFNNALIAAGQDGRVWGEFAGGLYKFYNQYTGEDATIEITDGTTNNIADDLKLGVANGGVETDGTDDQDFLLYTEGGITFSQPVESNLHRSGRFHTGIIKKKKVTEFDFDTYINMSGDAGDSLDNAVRLLWTMLLGTETVTASTFIDYTQGLPNKYCSAVRVSTIFGEYVNGMYLKQSTLSFPGDGPATMKHQGKAAESVIAGLAQILGAVVASTDVIVQAGQADRYEDGAPVMVVDPDGRTIVAGVDGTLTVDGDPDIDLDKVVLSAAVSVSTLGFLVPWDPGAVQQTGRDAVFTDLVGSFKINSADGEVDVTNVELSINNDHVDFDNRFGADANKGFAAGNRCTMDLSVTFDLSNETMGKVIQTRKFDGFSPVLTLGDPTTGRYMQITSENWIPSVPPIEVPQNGTTPVTLAGTLYQSAPGLKNPVRVRFG